MRTRLSAGAIRLGCMFAIGCAFVAPTTRARVIITAVVNSNSTGTSEADVRAVCEYLRPEFNCTKTWPFGAQGTFASPSPSPAPPADAPSGAPGAGALTPASRLRALEDDIDAFVFSSDEYTRRLGGVIWTVNEDVPIGGPGGETRKHHVTSQSDFSDFRIERPLTVLATPEGTTFQLNDPALLKVQDNAPRHLRQLSGIQFGDPDETFKFHRFSSGVHVYVVDGILEEGHDEFKNMFSGEGRVIRENFRSQTASDMYATSRECATAHGTHVGSLAAGYGYGVAKNASIVSVGVQPGCEESGFASDLIQGLSWVLSHHQSLPSPRPPALVTMSLLVSASPAADEIERVVNSLIDAGIIVVAAAGNFADDACLYVPARIPRVITVGAVDESFEGAWSWSNTGECVDIWSPGENILGAGSECEKCTAVFSGTSQATPIVTGLIAHMLETEPSADIDRIRTMLINDAESVSALPEGGTDKTVQFRGDA